MEQICFRIHITCHMTEWNLHTIHIESIISLACKNPYIKWVLCLEISTDYNKEKLFNVVNYFAHTVEWKNFRLPGEENPVLISPISAVKNEWSDCTFIFFTLFFLHFEIVFMGESQINHDQTFAQLWTRELHGTVLCYCSLFILWRLFHASLYLLVSYQLETY